MDTKFFLILINSHNNERYQNLNYQQNNHHVHMLQPPHLDVKRIQIQTVKENNYSDSSNQRFSNSKYDTLTDPFDFKSDISMTANNNVVNTNGSNNNNKNLMNLDQMPKYLLKQLNDTRVNRQSKNSGMSSKYEIVSYKKK